LGGGVTGVISKKENPYYVVWRRRFRCALLSGTSEARNVLQFTRVISKGDCPWITSAGKPAAKTCRPRGTDLRRDGHRVVCRDVGGVAAGGGGFVASLRGVGLRSKENAGGLGM